MYYYEGIATHCLLYCYSFYQLWVDGDDNRDYRIINIQNIILLLVILVFFISKIYLKFWSWQNFKIFRIFWELSFIIWTQFSWSSLVKFYSNKMELISGNISKLWTVNITIWGKNIFVCELQLSYCLKQAFLLNEE